MMKQTEDGYTEIDGHTGDLITVEEFKDACNCGAFIDYDGMGDLVRDNKIVKGDSTWIYPSTIDTIPSDITHILWYNR